MGSREAQLDSRIGASPTRMMPRSPNQGPPVGRSPLRVGIVQRIVPHYRIPLFRLIADHEDLELTVWSDARPTADSLQPGRSPQTYATKQAAARWLGPLLWQPALLEAVRGGRHDVVVLPWHAWSVHMMPALRAARRRGVRTLVWGHGYSKRENRVRRWARHRLLAAADGALLYSDRTARQLVERGVAGDRLHVAHNAIDQGPIEDAQASWRARPDALDAFRRENGLEGRAVVLFVSRLERGNALDLLLEATAALQRDGRDVSLVLVGDGSDRSRLEQRRDELGLQDHVRFPGAIYDENELAPWAMSATVFAYPVNMGLSVLHAFGYGLPVITSNELARHGPEIEAFRDGENGLLYRDGSAKDLGDKIATLLDDDARRQRMSEAARSTVTGARGFTIERMAEEYVAALRRVAASSSDACHPAASS
ncbi:MAG: glycosyltransferase family 4 protein [Planctomycetota bacterium]|jgi:glycosyltransferase involved in cell wall biosynthesis